MSMIEVSDCQFEFSLSAVNQSRVVKGQRVLGLKHAGREKFLQRCVLLFQYHQGVAQVHMCWCVSRIEACGLLEGASCFGCMALTEPHKTHQVMGNERTRIFSQHLPKQLLCGVEVFEFYFVGGAPE